MFALYFTPIALARLALLGLACADSPADSPLRQIALSINGTVARFMATDGRLLAVLAIPVTWDEGVEPRAMTLLLEQQPLTAMASTLRRSANTGLDLQVTLAQREREVRFAHPGGAHLVRLHEGTYPDLDATLNRFRESAWVPSMQSFDQRLLTTAARIAARKGLLPLCVPVAADSPLRTAWQTNAPTNTAIPAHDLRQAIAMPAMWADDTLLILVMGISRFGSEDHVGLSTFLATAAPAAAPAAA